MVNLEVNSHYTSTRLLNIKHLILLQEKIEFLGKGKQIVKLKI